MNDKTETAIEPDPIQIEQELTRLRFRRAIARRNFIKNAGLAGMGVAFGAMVEGCSTKSTSLAQTTTVPQTDVLNFALNLEYLEGEFYSVATTGATLSSSVTGGTSNATGGGKVTFTDSRVSDIANEIAADEALHVKYLRSALGSAAVAEPSINLNALGIGFASQAQFLTLARAFEDTGVSAYAGAATLLSGNNLQAAAQILAVEAYHAGNIRLYCVEDGIVCPAMDSQDVPPTEQHFFPTYSSGLAVIRTTSEVLAIVYANATPGTTKGGFFPNGVNGNIDSV
jgi:hypothetical protein